MKLKPKKIISLAPGRVCLFGDHQDYINLPVIACAIDRNIKLIAEENNGNFFHIKTPDINQERIIRIASKIEKVKKSDHLLSALKVLKRYGCVPNRGFNITISGDLPINAGTSSSTAVVVSWVKFLLEAFGSEYTVTPELVSQIAHEAEVTEHGLPGGRMDQYSIGLGNVLYLETNEKSINYEILDIPIKGLIVGESGIPKKTIGVLKELKKNAWLSINKVKEIYKNFDIRKASKSDLNTLLNQIPDELKPYLYAAISNHDITQRAFKELKKEELDFLKIGKLMSEHHQILKDILKITVPKIDDMIDSALNAGAYGAKIVGSGQGGCIVALAPNEKEQDVINAILKAGGKDAYKVNVDLGARIINN